MKIRGKNKFVVLTAVCTLVLMAAGCDYGSAPVNGAAEDEVENEMPEEQENTPVEAAADHAGDSGMDTVWEEEGTQEDEGDSEGRWHVFDPETAQILDADFEGVIWKTDADSFYIAESNVHIFEDGSQMSSSLSKGAEIPDSDLIQVVFDENTHFYIRTVYDGGARYEDKEAGFQNLEEYMSVEMKGEFINDVFHADEIRIISVS